MFDYVLQGGLVADGTGIGAIINLTIRNTCDSAGVRMSCHIGGTVDLLQCPPALLISIPIQTPFRFFLT